MTYDMYDWYEIEPNHWMLCRVKIRVMDIASVELYTYDERGNHETATGRARRLSSDCWLVTAKG